jgi:hypothetical protein
VRRESRKAFALFRSAPSPWPTTPLLSKCQRLCFLTPEDLPRRLTRSASSDGSTFPKAAAHSAHKPRHAAHVTLFVDHPRAGFEIGCSTAS